MPEARAPRPFCASSRWHCSAVLARLKDSLWPLGWFRRQKAKSLGSCASCFRSYSLAIKCVWGPGADNSSRGSLTGLKTGHYNGGSLALCKDITLLSQEWLSYGGLHGLWSVVDFAVMEIDGRAQVGMAATGKAKQIPQPQAAQERILRVGMTGTGVVCSAKSG